MAALNVVVEREGAPGRKVTIPVQDAAGEMARSRHRRGADPRASPCAGTARTTSSRSSLASSTRSRAVRRAGPWTWCEWATLDDESTLQFLALAEFGRNLGGALGKPDLWPRVILDDAAVAELERRLTAVCPALRNEGFLPDWEYSAEHKLPIVPEPLGLASLGRSEKRADPLPALFALTAIVLTAVAILLIAILAPPWVPGR